MNLLGKVSETLHVIDKIECVPDLWWSVGLSLSAAWADLGTDQRTSLSFCPIP